MAIEINREVLEDQLDKLSILQVAELLEAFNKKKQEYQAALDVPNYRVPKKGLKERLTFYQGITSAIEDYLAATFSIPEAIPGEQ